MSKISVVLATYNEEKNLKACLEAVKDLADEIIIVDGSSIDKTVEIAKSYDAQVVVTDNPPIFHINKQKAIDLAKYPWILQLDADEVVTKKLASEIKMITQMTDSEIESYQSSLQSQKLFLRHQRLLEDRDGRVGDSNGPYNAFFIPRRNYFLGKYLKYGGTYPDPAIRLIRKGKAYLPCKDVHEQMKVEGRVGWLENYMLHQDSPTLKRYLERNNRYIELMVKEMSEGNTSKSVNELINYMLIKPIAWFIKTLIRHKGILDGYQGVIFSFFSALRFPRAYWRYLMKLEKIKIGFCVSPLKNANASRGIGQNTRKLLELLKKFPEFEIYEFSDKLNHEVNIVHYPFFTFFQRTLPMKKKFVTVVTIHDVIPLVFPKHYPPGIIGRINFWYQKYSLKSVNHIITISESAKQDIHNYLNIPLSKIHSIPLGVSEEFKIVENKTELEKVRIKYRLPSRFLVYIGDVNWNKNLVNLTQAAVGSGWDIVFVGKAFENKQNIQASELKLYKEFLEKFENSPQVHLLGFIDTKDLVKIINLSSALMLPSYYEGFGLTILEAQSCGTVVITSHNSSIPEVAGESVIYVDPYSVESIKDGISKLADQRLVNQLIDKGLENVKKYSWQRTASGVAEVYRICLNS